MLMKESHSIFKLDEKQKELMHKLKQEDRDQKGPSFSHLKKKQDKYQESILKIPAERLRIMEKDQEYAMKKEREKLDQSLTKD